MIYFNENSTTRLTYTFHYLMERIKAGDAPSILRDHLFTHKEEIAKALQKNQQYEFKGMKNEIYRIIWADTDEKIVEPS